MNVKSKNINIIAIVILAVLLAGTVGGWIWTGTRTNRKLEEVGVQLAVARAELDDAIKRLDSSRGKVGESRGIVEDVGDGISTAIDIVQRSKREIRDVRNEIERYIPSDID